MLGLLIASSLEPRQSEDIVSASKFMPPLWFNLLHAPAQAGLFPLPEAEGKSSGVTLEPGGPGDALSGV